MKCKWCNGRGFDRADTGAPAYTCPDCNGTGEIAVCVFCGEEISGEYCENCYAQCKECGQVCSVDELEEGLCQDCMGEGGSI